MTKLNSKDTKMIIVKHIGPITVLPNLICGPILKPFKLSVEDIMHLVVTGHDTYEVLPNGKRIKLTNDNYDVDHSVKEQKIVKEEKKIEQEPVVEEVKEVEEKTETKQQNKQQFNNKNFNKKNNNK